MNESNQDSPILTRGAKDKLPKAHRAPKIKIRLNRSAMPAHRNTAAIESGDTLNDREQESPGLISNISRNLNNDTFLSN